MGQKRTAVLVGCNYQNTGSELHGCINDVLAIRELLVNRFGFSLDNIRVLTDEPGSLVKPTGANIKKALTKMIDQAEPEDVMFFHFSGHGTQVRSKHHTKQEEAIVPCDFNLIIGMEFRQLVNKIPEGSTFTILSDSCHCGGLIDQEKQQIGPHSSSSTPSNQPLFLPKSIPYESILHHLCTITNLPDSDLGTHLTHLFGDDSSPWFRLPWTQLESQLTHVRPELGVLLSGCQANETSADMPPGLGGGKARGAFSYAVERAVEEAAVGLSNREVVVKARETVKKEGFGQQHPCLYCSDLNADAMFLGLHGGDL